MSKLFQSGIAEFKKKLLELAGFTVRHSKIMRISNSIYRQCLQNFQHDFEGMLENLHR